MTHVKICGITRLDDAKAAIDAGAAMLGFNFYKKSPRYIEPEAAQVIADQLRADYGANIPLLIGVFVNALVSGISAISDQVGLHAAQLSGDESDSMLKELRGIAFKGIQPMNQAMALNDVQYYAPHFPQNERLPQLILDAYHPQLRGGTGETASADVVKVVQASVKRVMLAGGLTPQNVGERVAALAPWGVDVASGVEDDVPGVKNHDKVRAFVAAARA
jgi:phosphoribosylanthranilate isomerase